jgi:hypothetical protein
MIDRLDLARQLFAEGRCSEAIDALEDELVEIQFAELMADRSAVEAEGAP